MNDSEHYAKQIASMIKLQRNPDGIAIFFDYKVLQGIINIARLEVVQTLLSEAPELSSTYTKDTSIHFEWIQKICKVRDSIK